MPAPSSALRLIGSTAVAVTALAMMPAPAGSATDTRPRLTSFTYGRQHPAGADHSYWGIRMGTFDPDGSVVSIEIEQISPHGPIRTLDGGCRIVRPNGRRIAWFDPAHLRPGRYRFRVTLTSTTCGAAQPQLQVRAFTRRLHVAPARHK